MAPAGGPVAIATAAVRVPVREPDLEVHFVEGLFEEEGELEPEVWPHVLRSAPRSIEIRNRTGTYQARQHGAVEGRPAPRFQKRHGPPDPSRKEPVYHRALGRHVEEG